MILEEIKREIENQITVEYLEKYYSLIDNKELPITNLYKESAALEGAMILVSIYAFWKKSGRSICSNWNDLLLKIDQNEFFSNFKIAEEDLMLCAKNYDLENEQNMMKFLNSHDKFLTRDIRKKVGQFYTPDLIVKTTLERISDNINEITINDKVMDPAVGTGVFIIEFLKRAPVHYREFNVVSSNIFAYDVNPFAIVATKFNLLMLLLTLDGYSSELIDNLKEEPYFFPNIKLKNTLLTFDENKYSIIFGNPPYYGITKSVFNEELYFDILQGKSNIYGLFIFWSINNLIDNGVFSLVIPQSIKSSMTFKELREVINELRIKSIVSYVGENKVFSNAEQSILILTVEKKKQLTFKVRLEFRDKNNNQLSSLKVNKRDLTLTDGNKNFYIISSDEMMYKIITKLYKENQGNETIKNFFEFRTGNFVWNQNKDILIDESKEGTIPLIYANFVQGNGFDFSKYIANKEKKKYAYVNNLNVRKKYKNRKLLIQRVSSMNSFTRINACIISGDFLQSHEFYFIENHVNYLEVKDEFKSLGLEVDINKLVSAILNSKLINMVFSTFSGSTQVSATELNFLPFPTLEKMIHFVRENGVSKTLSESDICELYQLNETEINYILNK